MGSAGVGTGGGEQSHTQGSQEFRRRLVFVHYPVSWRSGHALTEVLSGGASGLAASCLEITWVTSP